MSIEFRMNFGLNISKNWEIFQHMRFFEICGMRQANYFEYRDESLLYFSISTELVEKDIWNVKTFEYQV